MTGGQQKTSSSLMLAYRLTEEASQVGFDWPEIGGILKKFDEELKELKGALSLRDQKKIEEEVGDLLFVTVNIARFLKIDPEVALRKTVKKFASRFSYVKGELRKKGKVPRDSTLLEMDQLWEEAKKKGRGKGPSPSRSRRSRESGRA